MIAGLNKFCLIILWLIKHSVQISLQISELNIISKYQGQSKDNGCLCMQSLLFRKIREIDKGWQGIRYIAGLWSLLLKIYLF